MFYDTFVAIDSSCGMVASTALVAVNGQFLVHGINGMVQDSGIPKGFLTVILLPVVANTPDVCAVILRTNVVVQYHQAIRGSMNRKVEIEIIIAVSRSIQVSCFILPFMVLLGWMIRADMSLVFNGFGFYL